LRAVAFAIVSWLTSAFRTTRAPWACAWQTMSGRVFQATVVRRPQSHPCQVAFSPMNEKPNTCTARPEVREKPAYRAGHEQVRPGRGVEGGSPVSEELNMRRAGQRSKRSGESRREAVLQGRA
jgi:hypothetical protein